MDQSNTQDPNSKKKHDSVDTEATDSHLESRTDTSEHIEEVLSEDTGMHSSAEESDSSSDSSSEESTSDSGDESSSTETSEEKHKIKIEFPFSDVVRAQAPKAFETIENVATEVTDQWKKDGDFSNLGLPHPLADVVASQALQKAKQLEKKLEEKGVISLAKMGFAVAKSQLETLTKKK